MSWSLAATQARASRRGLAEPACVARRAVGRARSRRPRRTRRPSIAARARRPGRIVEQQIIAFGDDQAGGGEHDERAGQRLLQRPLESRHIDGAGGLLPHPLQHVGIADNVERVGCAPLRSLGCRADQAGRRRGESRPTAHARPTRCPSSPQSAPKGVRPRWTCPPRDFPRYPGLREHRQTCCPPALSHLAPARRAPSCAAYPRGRNRRAGIAQAVMDEASPRHDSTAWGSSLETSVSRASPREHAVWLPLSLPLATSTLQIVLARLRRSGRHRRPHQACSPNVFSIPVASTPRSPESRFRRGPSLAAAATDVLARLRPASATEAQPLTASTRLGVRRTKS